MIPSLGRIATAIAPMFHRPSQTITEGELPEVFNIDFCVPKPELHDKYDQPPKQQKPVFLVLIIILSAEILLGSPLKVSNDI